MFHTFLYLFVFSSCQNDNGSNTFETKTNYSKFQIIAITPIPEGSGDAPASLDPSLREPVKCSASALVSSIFYLFRCLKPKYELFN